MLQKTLAVYREILHGKPQVKTIGVSTAHYPEVPVDL
jgi:hypothetical protein